MGKSATTTVLITGGNGGIGSATIEALLSSCTTHQYKIFLGCRSLVKGKIAADTLAAGMPSGKNHEIIPITIDIDAHESYSAFIDELREHTEVLDVLVNNAGAHYDFAVAAGQMTVAEAFEKAFRTNVVSTHLFTEAIMPLLFASSSPRVLFISSGISSLQDHNDLNIALNRSPPMGWPKPYAFNVMTYRTSKTAMNMMILEWVRVLKNDGVLIHCIDPGLLATSFGGTTPDEQRKYGAEEPIVGGRFIRDVIEGKRDQDVGKLINKDGIVPW